MAEPGPVWEICVDTGGTFTDCLTTDPTGQVSRVKVLSSSALRGRITGMDAPTRLLVETGWEGPDDLVTGFGFHLLENQDLVRRVVAFRAAQGILELDQPLPDAPPPEAAFELRSGEEAPLLAARLATRTPANQALPRMNMRLATTRGTNALLTRTGTQPVLFITRGFEDLLYIGDQTRPELFALNIKKPALLIARTVPVAGRLGPDGSELEPLNRKEFTRSASELARQGYRVAAVTLLHADKNPAHEHEIARLLGECGFTRVSCSSDLAPFIKILPRCETAVVDAYLSPVIDDYLAHIQAALRPGQLWAMTSSGGLVSAPAYAAKDSLLSGPAGGIAGAAGAGRESGFDRLITFDMGGTSTDVARYEGDFEYVFEHTVGDAHLMAPALGIESVAAGGGSVCAFDGIRLRVGPHSAGASPGPACYGTGGPLTVTDVNLLLGRIDRGRFEIPILPDASSQALEKVRSDLAAATGEHPATEELLEGFLELANQKMADAIRRISLRHGYDPADYALVAFGGAGPQHALAVADLLGIEHVVVPPHPALLSARGLAGAVIERFAERQLLVSLDSIEGRLNGHFDELFRQAAAELSAQGIPDSEIILRRRLISLRFAGQDATLEIDYRPDLPVKEAFLRRYQNVFGHKPGGRAIELVSIRTVASSTPGQGPGPATVPADRAAVPRSLSKVHFRGGFQEVPLYEREILPPGSRLTGPCLISETYSTLVIEPEWQVEVDQAGALVSHRAAEKHAAAPTGRPRTTALHLELFSNHLENIAREMGEALRRTAVSTNVKERLDFSCALLDRGGELIVNAPHIPVHLGSLGLCVREVVRALKLAPGDTVVTNHPAYGGSHLPDVTVISPVHTAERNLLGYVASRAHHAELGGILPGSMPPTATNLAEEGVVIPPTFLVQNGRADWDTITRLLTTGRHPTRALSDNLADLRAALAANHAGVSAMQSLVRHYGPGETAVLMQTLKKRAEREIRRAFSELGSGRYQASETLDDGSILAVSIEISPDGCRIDFDGSAGVHPGNLNATPAVVRSVVLYVLRLLVPVELPLNEGLMRAVELAIPPGILNPPFPDAPGRAPAVVGGNVETSQRLVNALVRALNLSASSQGTMNNLVFGNQRFSYYETVCGGCGAGPGFAGASAVHSHMTNTRITDPEVIEHRYPVRVRRFAVRTGSGGKGRHPGGDGVVREIEFLETASLSILSQHRQQGPAGLNGGQPGLPGSQALIRADGRREILKAIDSCPVGLGDCLVLSTPGGGGFGEFE